MTTTPGHADQAERVAVHEAGHAVAAVLLKGTPRGSVSAQPAEAAKAHLEYPLHLVAPGRWEARSPQFEADLLARLAGPAAERAILGSADPATEAVDERIVLDALLAKGRRGEGAATALDELRALADAFVVEALPVIQAASADLAARDRVDGLAFAAWVRSRVP